MNRELLLILTRFVIVLVGALVFFAVAGSVATFYSLPASQNAATVQP